MSPDSRRDASKLGGSLRVVDSGAAVLRDADGEERRHTLRDLRPLGSLAGRAVAIDRVEDDDIVCDDGWRGPARPRRRRLVVLNAGQLVTCDPALPGLGVIPDGAVVVEDGRVLWIGPTRDLPATICGFPVLDAGGALVTPGLVDPHTHPIFGGSRAGEFAMRARGASYQEIAAAGGGIAATMGATRAASERALADGASARLGELLRAGVTTAEVKTGYALDVEGEVRLARILHRLGEIQPVTLRPSLLGAHLVPPERRADRAAYVAECAGAMIAGARAFVTAVDVYCDEGAFTLAEARVVLGAAQAAGLAVRAHAGQFRDLGAAGLVADLGGLSADHLEEVDDAQARRMARAGTVAVLLPGACVQLRLAPPPVETLRREGVALALGTDMNPGSSMTPSLPLQMWLATTLLGMSVEEAWLGVTRVAARAAGRPEAGQLRPGAPGDIVVWRAADPAEIPYRYGSNLVRAVACAGEIAIG